MNKKDKVKKGINTIADVSTFAEIISEVKP